DGQQWKCKFQFKGQECQGTGETRDGAVMAATRYVTSKTTDPDVIEPSETQLNYIASLAAAGRLAEGIEKYLSVAIVKKNLSPRTILSDQRYSETLDRAVWFIWSRANNEFSFSHDANFAFYLEKYAAGKRFSVDLLN